MSQDRPSIFEQLTEVFRDVFDDDELVIDATTTAQDVDGWNSLAHIRLVVSIEKAFKLRFSAAEIGNLKNVGDMVELILLKQVNTSNK
jgi:acyl carrier protein